MGTQKFEKNSTKLVSGILMAAVVLFCSQSKVADAATHKQAQVRISHAKELLGNSYKKSSVRKTEGAENINEFVANSIKNLLPKKHKKSSREIASVIMRESERYGFDPIFLMAVIQNESSFNPQMKGGVGEIGLMQIKPDTAEWIAKTYKIDYKNADSLYRPEVNIAIGAAFMNKLRGQFSSNSSLYISAYNAGARKVRMMVSAKNTPKIYATAVMKRYFAMYSALGMNKGTQSERADLAFVNVKNITNKMVARN